MYKVRRSSEARYGQDSPSGNLITDVVLRYVRNSGMAEGAPCAGGRDGSQRQEERQGRRHEEKISNDCSDTFYVYTMQSRSYERKQVTVRTTAEQATAKTERAVASEVLFLLGEDG